MSSREQIEALKDELSRLIANKDVAAIAAFYEDEAFMLPPDKPLIEGRDGIVARHSGFLGTVETMEWRSEIIDIIESGDVVVDISHIRNSAKLRSGADHRQESKHIVVWRKQPDGTLKIAAEVINRDAPNADA